MKLKRDFAVFVFTMLILGVAEVTSSNDQDEIQDRRYCSATTHAQFKACRHEKLDDFYGAKALCLNISDDAQRGKCFEAARKDLQDGRVLCAEQRAQRLDICKELGEARYDRSFDPADFENDYHHLNNPHPYFPLTIGYRWDYSGTLETNTITSLDKTKLIEGVTCIVLNDKRYEDGRLAEDTDDWYGQRKDGTVEFCGEAVSNFETFPGDKPPKPERVSTEGQWKTGRDGVPSGAYILGHPRLVTSIAQSSLRDLRRIQYATFPLITVTEVIQSLISSFPGV